MTEVVWDAYPYQYGLFTSECPFILTQTGLGAGKSWAGARKSAMMCNEWPGVNGIMCANSYKQLKRNVIPPFKEALEELELEYKFNKQDGEFIVMVPNEDEEIIPTSVLVFSMRDYDELRGYELGWAWLDEPRDMKREAFDVLVGRMRDKRIPEECRQVWLTTTPDGFNWVNDVFAEPDPGTEWMYETFTGKSTDNYRLGERYFQIMRASYDEDTLKQEMGGEVLSLSGGKLYSRFTRSANMPDGTDINDNPDTIKLDNFSPVYLCWDNNADPLVCEVVQERRDGTYAVDEVYLRNSDIYGACEALETILAVHQGGIYIDGDARSGDKNASTGKSDYALIEECLGRWYNYGIETVARQSNPPIVDRVNAVNARIRGSDGIPRLFISPRCKELRKDFEQVVPKKDARHPDGNKNKLRTHTSDAIGYHIVKRFGVSAFREELEELKALAR